MILAVLDHLWQSTLCLGAVGLLTLLLRRNGAHTRYWLWFAASLKFLVPFELLVNLGSLLGPRDTIPTLAPAAALPIASVVQEVSTPFVAAGAPLSVPEGAWPDISDIALAVWLLGMLIVTASWLVRWRRLRTLVHAARPLAIAAPVPVRSTSSAVEPGLVGIWRPVLLMPEGLASHLSSEETRSILAHELSHLRRRDNLTFAMHMLSQAVFWFYPLTWWLGRRLIAERERACDEAVLASGHEAHIYAESILKVCRLYVPAPPACTSGVSGASLKDRVEAIMNGRIDRRVPTAKRVLVLTLGVAGIAAPLVVGMLTAQPASAQAPTQSLSSPAATTPAEIAQRRYDQSRPQTVVPFDPKDFDKFAGYYELGPTAFLHVFRNGDHYFAQLTGQHPVENFPESATEFFATVVAAQISFVIGPNGRVTGLVLHQNGFLQPAQRVSEAAAKAAATKLQQRLSNNIPSPGTQASLLRYINSLETGRPNYDEMSSQMAAVVQAQLPMIEQIIHTLGAFQAMTFKGVSSSGFDVYDVTFAHGRAEWSIAPLSADGKVLARGFRELP